MPWRIISSVPSFTEILFALGAGDRVVAVSSFCRHPEKINSLPKIGGLLDPNLERVLSLKPDLIVLMASQRDLAWRYESLGIRTLRLEIDTLDQMFTALRLIGEAVGTPAAAKDLADKIRRDLDRVADRVRGRPRPRTVFVIEHEPGALRQVFVAGTDSYLGSVLALAGGENILSGLPSAYAKVSIERIVQTDPEVILVMTGKDAITDGDREAERKLWGKLPTLAAVKTGRVVLIRADPVSIPGPRLAESVELISRVLHPDAWNQGK